MAGSISFRPTQDDYVAAQRDWFVGSMKRWQKLLLVPVIAVVGGAGAGLVTLSFESVSGAVELAIIVAITLVFTVPLCWLANYLLLPWRARRLFRQDKTLDREFQVSWSEQNVTYRWDGGSSNLAWSDLHRWHEGSRTILLMLNERLYHFLPRRAFGSADVEDLVAALHRFGPPRF